MDIELGTFLQCIEQFKTPIPFYVYRSVAILNHL